MRPLRGKSVAAREGLQPALRLREHILLGAACIISSKVRSWRLSIVTWSVRGRTLRDNQTLSVLVQAKLLFRYFVF